MPRRKGQAVMTDSSRKSGSFAVRSYGMRLGKGAKASQEASAVAPAVAAAKPQAGQADAPTVPATQVPSADTTAALTSAQVAELESRKQADGAQAPSGDAQPAQDAAPAASAPVTYNAPVAASKRQMGTAARVAIILGGILVALVLVAPLLAVSAYDRPSGDDFSYALATSQLVASGNANPITLVQTAVQTSLSYMQTWQGLYTSAFLLALQPGIFGMQYYGIGAIVLIVCTYLASLYFTRRVERSLLGLPARWWIPAGIALATFLLLCMPDVCEGIYWFNGAWNYTPFFLLALVNAGLSIRSLTVRSTVAHGFCVVGLCVLLFLTSGGDHVMAFYNLMLALGCAVIGFARRRWAQIFPLLVGAFGFYLNVTAPGTAVRQAFFVSPGIPKTIAVSALYTLQSLQDLLSVSFLLLLVILTPILWSWAGVTQRKVRGVYLVVFFVLSYLAIVGLNCAPYYGMGVFGEGRVRNVVWFASVVQALMLYGYALCVVRQRARNASVRVDLITKNIPYALVALGIVACIVGVAAFGGASMGKSNALLALNDMRNGSAAQFAQENDERDQILSEAKSTDLVAVPRLESHPVTLFFTDLDNDMGDDWASTVAAYYGLVGVVYE